MLKFLKKIKNIENIVIVNIGDHTYEIIKLVEFEIEYNKLRDVNNNKIVSDIVSDDTNHFMEYLETVSQDNLGKLQNLLKYLAEDNWFKNFIH